MLKSDLDLSDEAYLDRLRQSFPAAMNQQDDSNNQKIINIFSGIENYYKDQLLEMNKLNILENVKGDALTQLAKDWGINRVDSDDDFLRFQIRFAMWRMHLGVGINEIKQFISFIMNIEPSDFQINSTGVEDIEVNNIPFSFSKNEHAELKTKLLVRSIESILPTEWNLTNVQFSKKAFTQLYYGIYVVRTPIKKVMQKPFDYSRSTQVELYQGIVPNGSSLKSKYIKQKGAN